MNSEQLCTTAALAASRGERLTRDPHFAGGWRPLSTDPAIVVPVLGSPARRTR
ncbi:hypothetical protein C8D87_10635 [Lentzea atacamensis]|uniref:Uncharacterized protein n=1 Tax=Lentzea atacamensis TaxID=531938 RepID=A0ABX9E796_9PSEU|nr:hypothetical protein [Lentzea atacamensis]RAS63634.1 hypothetical protein C8D87_10635 [Lentzea atacamensis]